MKKNKKKHLKQRQEAQIRELMIEALKSFKKAIDSMEQTSNRFLIDLDNPNPEY